MPPPPAQTTTDPALEQPGDRLDLDDLLRLGGGHHAAPGRAVLPERPALVLAERVGVRLGVDGADELGRVGERRVVRVDRDHGEDRDHRPVRGEHAPQLLLDEVADHALGSRVQDVQGVGFGSSVGLGLQGQQAHLRSVAVHDDEAVLRGQRCERLRRDPDVAPLYRGGHRVGTPQQCVPAQCDHDPHIEPPASAGDRPQRSGGTGSGWLILLRCAR